METNGTMIPPCAVDRQPRGKRRTDTEKTVGMKQAEQKGSEKPQGLGGDTGCKGKHRHQQVQDTGSKQPL